MGLKTDAGHIFKLCSSFFIQQIPAIFELTKHINMETIINAPSHWIPGSATQTHKIDIYNKWLAFEDSQAKSKTLWYMVSLIAQGVLFLPLPAMLMYYYNAPIVILVITLTLYFANIIAGMGGSGIRTLISLFAFSVIVHLVMLATFVL